MGAGICENGDDVYVYGGASRDFQTRSLSSSKFLYVISFFSFIYIIFISIYLFIYSYLCAI